MDFIDRTAYRIFGNRVRSRAEKYHELQIKIRQANIPLPVDQFVSTAHFYSILAGIVAGSIGFRLSLDVFDSITIPAITPGTGAVSNWVEANTNVLLPVTMGLLLFIIIQQIIYFIYTSIPTLKASIRKSAIDLSLPHAVIYLYALSRGGMNLLDIFRSLSTYSYIYGTSAEEFGNIVKDIEYFNHDMPTALRNASIRTPSEKFKDFLDGMDSVIISGGNITTYLKSKSEQYQSIAVREQKNFMETLGILAEVYISVFVAGPLFLITILVILGLIGPGATELLYLLVYAFIPSGTVIFLLVLGILAGASMNVPKTYIIETKIKAFEDVPLKPVLDPKEESRRIKWMRFHKSFSQFTDAVLHPMRMMRNNARSTFVISIPIGILYLAYVMSKKGVSIGSIGSIHFGRFNVGQLAALDDHIIFSVLIVLVPFVVFYELKARHIKQIEDMVPEFLKRLASINEAGISLTDAIDMTSRSKIGILRDEIKRVSEDISWGASTASALSKLEYRIRTNITTRIITLIIKASESTSDIRSVLAIAANNADVEKQLKTTRSAEMFVYMFIVYIAFFVFLFIVYVLTAFFLPAMPASVGETAADLPFIQDFDIEEYTTLFFHAAVIQGFCSGLVAGQMGSGSMSAGLKHSVIMIIISYGVFAILI